MIIYIYIYIATNRFKNKFRICVVRRNNSNQISSIFHTRVANQIRFN